MNSNEMNVDPFNLRLVAIPLVELMAEHMSWNDRKQIAIALIEIHRQHRSLMEEHRRQNSFGMQSEQSAQEPTT